MRGSRIVNVVPCADLGLDLDRAAVALDDAVDDRQAEAGALADVLGGEERVEDARQHLGAGCRGRCRAISIVTPVASSRVAIADRRVVAADQRLGRVGQQVHEHLVELAGVAADPADLAVVALDVDRTA